MKLQPRTWNYLRDKMPFGENGISSCVRSRMHYLGVNARQALAGLIVHLRHQQRNTRIARGLRKARMRASI